MHLQTQPPRSEGSGAWQRLWQHRVARWQLLSKLRDAPSLRDAQKRSDRGCREPPHLCHIRYADSLLRPQTFGVSFTSPLPPHHPNPIPGEGSGHRPAEWGSAALRPHGGSGEGHSGNNQERRRSPDLGGSQRRGDAHARRTHPCASGQSAWLRGAGDAGALGANICPLDAPRPPQFLASASSHRQRSQSPPQCCTIYSEFTSAF